MKKLIKKVKSRAGFTLTEMLVTVALLSLFGSAVLVGMTTAYAVRRDSIKVNDADILASLVTNYISNELRTAVEVGDIEFEDMGENSETFTYGGSAYANTVTIKLVDQKIVFEKPSGETYSPFGEGAYSDKAVGRLGLKDLYFNLIDDTDDEGEKVSAIKVSFDVINANDDSVIIHREFSVGLLTPYRS